MAAAQYLERVYLPSKLGLSPGYVRRMRIAASQWDRWSRGVPINDWSEPLFTSWLQHRSETDSAPTINGKRRAILSLWRHAATNGLTQSPGTVPRFREPKRIPEAWSVSEVESIVCVCRSAVGRVGVIPARLFWPSLVMAVYYTGARISKPASSGFLPALRVPQDTQLTLFS